MENGTDYQLSTSVNEGIIEIVFTGEVTADAVKKLQNEVFAIVKSINARDLIIDVRALKGRFGVTEAYYRVRSYSLDTARVNTAIVDIEENAAYESFHETTAKNVGRSLKSFTDIDAARAWLKSMQRKRSGSARDSG
jgi:hypothetical protein